MFVRGLFIGEMLFKCEGVGDGDLFCLEEFFWLFIVLDDILDEVVIEFMLLL